MKRALHPIVDAAVLRLSAEQREAWEERAAILEFEGGHARELAEALALVLMLDALLATRPLRSSE